MNLVDNHHPVTDNMDLNMQTISNALANIERRVTYYNPTIVYDASCRLKEFGLNREPSRFTQMRFVTDPLHIENHSSCMESFRSIFSSNKQFSMKF